MLRAEGEVIRVEGNKALLRKGKRKFEMGLGALLLWEAFKEGATVEEVRAQIIALTGMSRDEAERIVHEFVSIGMKSGLIVAPSP
ncbi:hypothetical protein EYM_01135 [Ignicoccus islandicus DSM 13165]|uniref:PqqD family protein n=1 Tax=Ignicoccus islandicus DSM 13165 TaxID=940295 RepID=A0A0U2U7V1_9CREN|nr:PqqD family protein [Ignicoccus islandicus]ALU12180.1 hypothetical protein EYM_01135 [Ignicoccus islandicus DSM 13165]